VSAAVAVPRDADPAHDIGQALAVSWQWRAGVLPRFDRAAAGPADSAWTVSGVMFTGSLVTFAVIGVCE
jgi:cellulase/cellobiase CelA1